jgi:hypothetical protein
MPKLRAVQLCFLALLICAFAGAVRAQGRWEYLGEANVDGAVDHDRITVTAARGEYRAIRIRVERGPIEFDRVVVHFRDGESEPIAIRNRIRAGGETRVIDLPGRRRIIESVEFWYRRANWRERRPKVRLFGLH